MIAAPFPLKSGNDTKALDLLKLTAATSQTNGHTYRIGNAGTGDVKDKSILIAIALTQADTAQEAHNKATVTLQHSADGSNWFTLDSLAGADNTNGTTTKLIGGADVVILPFLRAKVDFTGNTKATTSVLVNATGELKATKIA